ncbi:MAG TPA: xanthine dehydrogenase family protein subunit M [Paraburkholderia sp.]|uniref:FAD binding domain-containing protein n=1 Tax=Paraburkholderia sp. TaxID=1926495 RepID=UPI002BBC53AF|nr:xanthine dehydrogenase family protein subunit M [Paraburkholderia sp.]HTR09963.1 xanthine dehydrogenase family protein subunit M [Paraburkholderia sp.]
MYAFNYQRASDAQGAVKTLAGDTDAKFLGGGQSLLAAMKLRLAQPSTLVDVTRIPELKAIEVNGKVVKVGAAVCHADVAGNAQIQNALPALADLAGKIGDRQVRALGTLGGSLANDDPAADYPAAVLALNATVVTDRRRIAADDFFRGMYETALEPDELIVAVEFQVPERAAYEKFPNPASHFALTGVFVAKYADAAAGGPVRVAVTGAGASVFRASALEDALKTNFAPEAARAVTMPADDLNTDLHASAAYRAHLIPVLAARAVTRANG